MIKACFHFEEDTQKITGVEISGHAEMAEYGYDIVCASVRANVENGITSFEIDEDDPLKSTQAQAIVNTLYIAMVGLEDEYEDYIEVTITED